MTATDETLTEEQQRAIWAELPITDAYPIGSRWTHRSYGATVHEVAGHRGAAEVLVRDTTTGLENYWPRRALDLHGSPAPSATDATPAHNNPTPPAGELVHSVSGIPYGTRVTIVRSQGVPSGLEATLVHPLDGERNSNREMSEIRSDHGHLVRLDGEAMGWTGYGRVPGRYWWVGEVRPVDTPPTPPTPALVNRWDIDNNGDATGSSLPERLEGFTIGDRVRITGHAADADVIGKAGTLEVIDRADAQLTFWVNLDDGGHRWAYSLEHETPADESASWHPASVTLTPAELSAKIEVAKREERRRLQAEFETWKERANETAIQYARDNSLCGEFERCMEEIGFRGREEEFTVRIYTTVTVTARDADQARDEAYEYPGNMSAGDWSYEVDPF